MTASERGTGLGLTIALAQATALGAELRLANDAAGGASASLVLHRGEIAGNPHVRAGS